MDHSVRGASTTADVHPRVAVRSLPGRARASLSEMWKHYREVVTSTRMGEIDLLSTARTVAPVSVRSLFAKVLGMSDLTAYTLSRCRRCLSDQLEALGVHFEVVARTPVPAPDQLTFLRIQRARLRKGIPDPSAEGWVGPDLPGLRRAWRASSQRRSRAARRPRPFPPAPSGCRSATSCRAAATDAR